jgi:hypothetical protein
VAAVIRVLGATVRFATTTPTVPGGVLVGPASQPVGHGVLETHAADVCAHTGGASSGTTNLPFQGASPLGGLSMPHADAPFSAAAFLRGMSPRPTSVAAADNALAAALANAKTAAAAAEERMRRAALAWEHEHTTADALARQVAEAERLLHASAGERVASSQQSPSTAPLPGVEPPGGPDNPMVAYLHLQAVGVPHIKTLVTVVLDSNSTSYARWQDQLLLVLRRYALDSHVLSDTPARARDPAWRHRDCIIMSWISGTISLDLQDIVRAPDPTARVMWLSVETQFLGNAQKRTLQLDAELRTLEQGDLSVSDYCRKMMSTADGLRDLGFTVPEHILVLNVLWGLPSNYEAVQTLLTHQQPPPTFLQVCDALTLEELTRGHQSPASTTPSSSTSRALVTAPPPSSASPPASLLGAPPPGPSGGGGVGGAVDAVVGAVGRLPPRLRPPSCSSSRRCALADSHPWSGRISMWPYQGQGGRGLVPRTSRRPWSRVLSPTRRPGLHLLRPARRGRGGGIRLPWRSPSALWG